MDRNVQRHGCHALSQRHASSDASRKHRAVGGQPSILSGLEPRIFRLLHAGDDRSVFLLPTAWTAAQVSAAYNLESQPGTTGTDPPPTPSPAPSPSSTPSPSGTPSISYNASTACINHVSYTNNVLPSGEGEFATNGLDRSYWGGVKTRTVGVNAGAWGPGFQTSWGRHQYDTYFGDSSDGTGYDPFAIVADSGASGSPQALRIEAMPVPAPIATCWRHGQRSVAGDECGLELRRTKRRRLARAEREQPQRRADRLENRDGVSRRGRHVRRHADLGRRDSQRQR